VFRLRSLAALSAFGLVAAVLAVPSPARSQDKAAALSDADKAKQVAELEAQLKALQAKLAAAKAAATAAPPPPAAPAGAVPEAFSKKLKWRSIGPANMSGRVTALAVNESDPTMFWVGTASGGLLKTVNAGTTFDFQFDDQTTVSVGDVAVSASDPKVVWVGTGENNPRNSVSYGDGVYKSTDGGKTWKNMGLQKTYQVGKVLIHPTNPDVVYVGALGRLYGANEDRGVFKTEDGGKTWKKVQYVDANTGVIDMRMDPTDPNTIIAAFWEHKRDEFDGFFGTPPVPDAYGPVVTHAKNTALYKTTDAGKSWKKLTAGLPTAKLGRIGLDYSRKTKGLLYAVIDTEKSGSGTASDTYFGAVMDTVANGGGVKLSDVTADSPAAKAGLKAGDVVVKVDAVTVKDSEGFVDYFQGKKPGDKITVTAKRDGMEKEVKAEVTLGRRGGDPEPKQPKGQNPKGPNVSIGVRFARGERLTVGQVVPDGPAAKAGVKDGDDLVAVEGKSVPDLATFYNVLAGRKAGDKLKVTVSRGGKKIEAEIVLGGPPAGGTNAPPRGQTTSRPFGLGLGGQQPNVQRRQGKDGNETGGVFMSKDNGDTWTRVNSFNPRPMYFSQIRVDPTDDDTVYMLGDTPTPLFRSTDGGKTFASVATARGVHADAHALWINPKDNRHLLIGCDGGWYVSRDKGATWDHQNVAALGQFYHVAVDNRRPYRVYGGLQDNGSWGGPSDSLRAGSGPYNEDWVFVSGGDGFVCRVDPTDPDLVYAESQGGAISRRNYRTGERGFIRPARTQGGPTLRFNWNTPFILSSHNPSIFYSGAQFVFKSVKKGDDLKTISPELTRTKAGSMTALSESPRQSDVLWAGTDDGHVWVTKSGGEKWENVTANLQKAGVSGYRWVASLEASKEKDGKCYVALDGHRSDDDKPYLFVTEDYGATWKPITGNLPAFGSTRVLREDIVNPAVLYCGTEFGAFVSANRGASWTKLGGNLPTVACHEFAQPTTADELVVATHGRSVWVIDINALRQFKPEVAKAPATLFNPSPAVRWKLGAGGESPYSRTDRKFVGENPTRGATFDVYVTAKAKTASLKVVDALGKILWTYAPNAAQGRPPLTDTGLHRVTWNLSGTARRPGGGRQTGGGQVPPGNYKVVLTVDDKEYTAPLVVEMDPNAAKDLISTEGEGETEAEDDAEGGKKFGKVRY